LTEKSEKNTSGVNRSPSTVKRMRRKYSRKMPALERQTASLFKEMVAHQQNEGSRHCGKQFHEVQKGKSSDNSPI
jgi:hypothetical protein